MTDVPFMALTASASADTESAIVKSLHPAIVTCQLHRANIYRIMHGLKINFVVLKSTGIKAVNLGDRATHVQC